jgi:hypothetical protein
MVSSTSMCAWRTAPLMSCAHHCSHPHLTYNGVSMCEGAHKHKRRRVARGQRPTQDARRVPPLARPPAPPVKQTNTHRQKRLLLPPINSTATRALRSQVSGEEVQLGHMAHGHDMRKKPPRLRLRLRIRTTRARRSKRKSIKRRGTTRHTHTAHSTHSAATSKHSTTQ